MGFFFWLRLQETMILKHGQTPWAAPARSAPTSPVLYGSMVAVAVEDQLIRATACRLLLEVDGPMSRKGHPRAELISVQHAWHMKKPASTLPL